MGQHGALILGNEMDKDLQKHLQTIKEKVAKWPKEKRDAAFAYINSGYCRIITPGAKC